jgi:hypothetical protein
MHAIGANDALGYTIFCAIKLAGYIRAARAIASIYEAKTPSIWVVGLTRTLLGMGAGVLLYFFMESLAGIHPFLLMLPLRAAEWWFVIWLFYGRKNPKKNTKLIVFLATIWSYVLDIPAAVGFLTVGGTGIGIC